MTEETAPSHNISQLCRRRGVVRASVTHLGNRLKELEDTEAQPTTPAHAQQLYTKLKDLNSNRFKEFHLLIIDQIDGDEALEAEQVVLDKYDDDVANLTVRLQRLMNSDSTTPTIMHDRE